MNKKAVLRASAIPAAAFLAGILLGTSSSRSPAPPPGGGDSAAPADAPVDPGVLALLDADAPVGAGRTSGARAAEAASPRPIAIDRVSLQPCAPVSGKARVVFSLDEAMGAAEVSSNVLPHVSVSCDGVPLPTQLQNVETRAWRNESLVYLGLSADAPVTNATVCFGAELHGVDRAPLGEAVEKDVWYQPDTIAIDSAGSDVGRFSDRAAIWFELTGNADFDSLRDHLRISPEPEGGWTLARDNSWYSDRYKLAGSFRPDTKYELSLRSGVCAPDGLPFALSTNAVPLRTARAPVAMELLSKGHYLTPRDRVGVAFRTRNAPHADVTLARILPQNVGELARRREGSGYRAWWDDSSAQNDSYDLAEHPMLHHLAVVAQPAAPDAVVTNVLALEDFADAGLPLRGGAYLLGIKATDTNASDAATCTLDRLVVVSDVGLQVRRTANRLDAFATRLSTGRPLADATLSFFAANGAPLATLPADARGCATLAEPDSLHRAHLVSATLPDGDWTFLVLRGENEVEETPADAPAGADHYPASPFALAGALFSDRGIYRHGEPVVLEALVRTAKTGRAPDPLPLELAVKRPDGVAVTTLHLVSDARGRVAPAAPWVVPEGQPSGKWTAELRIPGSAAHGARSVLSRRTFSVEEFAPPQIKAQVLDLPETVPCTEKTVAFRLRGDYFFGAVAAGRPARARALLRNAPFRPAGYDAKRWRFGPADDKDEIFEDFSVGAGSTGEDGLAGFSFDWAGTRAKTAPGPVRCVVEGTVQEPGGRQIAARAATTLHVRPWYLGVGTDPAAPGEPLPVDVALVAPDGSAAEDVEAEISLRFCKVNHTWDYELDPQGRWTWRDKRWEDLVAETNLVAAGGDARAAFRVPAVPGRYVVHASWKGPDGLVTATDREFGAWGGQSEERSLAGPARLTVAPDRKTYAPGDTARVEIRSPFPGVARVVLQRDTVLETRLVEMTNETASVSFYVSPDMAPGFEIAASVVRPVVPEADWGPHRASGAVAVRVEDPARAIAPALDAPAVSFKDGRASVAVRVALPAGVDPAAARATFFLVDEAVLDLTGEKTPDPAKALFPGYRTFAEIWDTYAALFRVVDGPYAKTAKIGGDGLGGLLSRLSPVTSRRFKPLALAAQDVAFGPDGAATATFDLGAFTGEIRLTAIVWTDRAAGAASAKAKVAPALVVQPDAPRFLAPGDRTEFTATIHNTTKEHRSVDWRMETAGPDPAPGAFGCYYLAPGASRTLPLEVALGADAKPGHVAFSVAASVHGSGETNRVEIEIPVRPPVAAKTVTETVALEPGAVWTNAAPAGFLPGAASLRVSLEPSPAAQALPALRYLTFYPHGCCEQTTSAVFPLVWAQGALLSFAERGEELPGDPEAKIRHAIARLGTMARGDRFAMWPDVSYCNDFDSLHAAHFLVEADRAGFDVPRSLRAVALSTARRALQVGPDDLRARASLVLATAGSPDETWLLRLLDRRPGLSPAARAQLALALVAAGRPDDALETLRAVPSAAAADKDRCWWQEDRGAVQDAAWGVVAWLAMPSEDSLSQASALYARLLSLRPEWAEGHWGWTTVNADALLATASMLRRAGGADRAAARRFPRDVAAVTNGADAVRFLVRTARGLPVPETVSAETNNLVVARSFFTREGEPLDPTGADEEASILQGDTVVVAIDLTLAGARKEVSDLVVQELLPAGLEIVAVGREAQLPWAGGGTHDWLLRADARDDRLLAFSRTIRGKARLVYVAQAVSPGDFVLPALSAEGMYDPLVRGSTAPGRLRVFPADGEAAERRREAALRKRASDAPGADGKPPAGCRYHVVAEGETLYHLAARFRVPVARLRELNHLDGSIRLEPGTRLAIPGAAR